MIAKVRYCVDGVGRVRATQYALRTLLEMIVSADCLVAGAEMAEQRDDEVLVTYGSEPAGVECGVHIFASGFFGDYYGTIDAMPEHPVVRIESIAALYHDDRGPRERFYSVQDHGQGVRVDCHVDIVAGAFFMLSRYEETVVHSVDAFGRFPAESSITYGEGFLQEPIVNQYAEQLLNMLRAAGFTGERRRWWGTAPWTIALTHDIDRLHRFPHGRFPALAVARSITGRSVSGAPSLRPLLIDYAATTTRRKRDEYDCLDDMAIWESSVGIHSSYYFLGDSTSGRLSADYAVDATGFMTKMKSIADLGHEVGFHAGFHACDNVERFHRELSRVRSSGLPVAGGRQHYLRWQTPATWRLWEGEGLAYDATLGYSKAAGFRCGTCLPYHPYDIEDDREMSILEWPLMFMDATYLSDWPGGMEVLARLSQECQRYGGVLVLLWHNSGWSNLYAPAVRECFGELLTQSVTHGVVVDSVDGLTRIAGIASADRVQHGIR